MNLIVKTAVLGLEAAHQFTVPGVHDRPLVVSFDMEHVSLPRRYGLPVAISVGEDLVLLAVRVDDILRRNLGVLKLEEGLDRVHELVVVGKVVIDAEQLVQDMALGRQWVRHHVLDGLELWPSFNVPLVHPGERIVEEVGLEDRRPQDCGDGHGCSRQRWSAVAIFAVSETAS